MTDWAPWAKRTLVLTSTPFYTGNARKITLHTMECGGERQACWPAYGNGSATPHFSLSPGTKEARQHIPLSRSARALASPGGGRSPNINAGVNIQIEVVGHAKDVYRYSDDWYRQLAEWVGWIASDQKVPLQFPYSFVPNASGSTRVDWDSFRNVSGLVAHQNVPFNDHWDAPFDQARLSRYLVGSTPPGPTQPSISDQIRRYGMFFAHSQHNKDHWYLIGPTSARRVEAQTFHNLRDLGVPVVNKVVTDETIRDVSDTGTAKGGIAAPGVDEKRGPG